MKENCPPLLSNDARLPCIIVALILTEDVKDKGWFFLFTKLRGQLGNWKGISVCNCLLKMGLEHVETGIITSHHLKNNAV